MAGFIYITVSEGALFIPRVQDQITGALKSFKFHITNWICISYIIFKHFQWLQLFLYEDTRSKCIDSQPVPVKQYPVRWYLRCQL